MNLQLMFPKDYFTKEVEDAFKTEFDAASSCGFETILINEDSDICYGYNYSVCRPGTLVLYRGWMKHLHQYKVMYGQLSARTENNMRMLVTPQQYGDLHYFSSSYEMIKDILYTPKIMTSPIGGLTYVMPSVLKEHLGEYFILKDDVKSVKGSDFPTKISTDISKQELDSLVYKFISLRGKLFTDSLVFKHYEPLKKYGDCTNEYRVFYFLNEVLSIEPNSNQPYGSVPGVPYGIVCKAQNLPSPFYTIDFAEMENGEWMVVETGDGQVSGLSPNQNPFFFYSKLMKGSHYGW